MNALTPEQQALVADNIRLVPYVIKRHFGNVRDVDYDDLYQEGSMGLCNAAASYDPERGKFSVFAYVVIQRSIFLLLKRSKGKRKVPQHLQVSLDTPVTDESNSTLAELVADASVNVEAEALSWSTEAAVRQAIDAIRSAPARRVLELHLLDGHKQSEVARITGFSASRVSAIIARNINAIRTGLNRRISMNNTAPTPRPAALNYDVDPATLQRLFTRQRDNIYELLIQDFIKSGKQAARIETTRLAKSVTLAIQKIKRTKGYPVRAVKLADEVYIVLVPETEKKVRP